MKLWRSSMSEDSVDRYNHTWSVLLFVVLALVTWLLPLATLTTSSLFAPINKDSPHVEVTCQQPSHWSGDYLIKVCHNSMNRLLSDPQSTLENGLLRPFNFSAGPNFGNLTDFETEHMDMFLTQYQAKEDAKSELETTLFLWTPLLLFAIALCLKVPHVIWSLLVTCCGQLNVDRVLTTTKNRQNLDQESSRQLRKDLGQSIKDNFRNGQSSATAVSYLIMKLLTIIAALAGVLIMLVFVLSDLDEARDAIQTVGADRSQSEYMTCSITIFQVQSQAEFSLQCLFTVSTDVASLSSLASIYRTVVIAAACYLIALLLVNAISFFSWVFSLSLCREDQSEFLPLDGHFLLAMARLNGGPLVSRDISHALSEKAEV